MQKKTDIRHPLFLENVHTTFLQNQCEFSKPVSRTGSHRSYTYHLLFKDQRFNFSYVVKPKTSLFP